MKVCLINPPNIFHKDAYYEYMASFYTFPHLGLGYIAAMLEENGYKVDILECCGQGIGFKELFGIIQREKYDIIGLSTYYYNYMQVLRIVEGIKSKSPATFIFAGGYLPTLDYMDVMQTLDKLDCCVIGEGEITCLELADAVKNGRKLDTVQGLAFRDGDVIKTTALRPFVKDLDSLPIPKRVFVADKLKSAAIITSRGCYGRCNFCGQREFYEQNLSTSIRYRKPEKVVEEIEYLIKQYGLKSIRFCDDVFFDGSQKRREWLKQFCELMKQKNTRISFRMEARANDVIKNEDLFEPLKEVGLERVFIGIESLVQRQLDFYEKAVTVEQNLEAMQIVRKHNIKMEFGLLMLEPFVTIDELIENISKLRDSEFYDFTTPVTDFISISNRRLVAIPGTKVYRQLEEMGKITQNSFFYEFQNSEVALYYDITKVWEKQLMKFPQYNHLIYLAEEKGRDDLAEEVVKENSKLKMMDINMVEDLCMKIKDMSIRTVEDSDKLLDSWEEMIKPVYRRFSEIKENLDRV